MEENREQRIRQILTAAEKQIALLFYTHQKQIDRALLEQDGEVSVSLTLKLKDRGKTADVSTGIGYTVNKVKDQLDEAIAFDQADMFYDRDQQT